jgi:scyllo-inositol 2-dehydrogenase (NADP+)
MTPRDADYGFDSVENDGRLGTDAQSVLVATERGAYPSFYAQLASAIISNAPPPVDPFDSLAAVDVIERLHARGM